jgi:hypothetical protein
LLTHYEEIELKDFIETINSVENSKNRLGTEREGEGGKERKRETKRIPCYLHVKES